LSTYPIGQGSLPGQVVIRRVCRRLIFDRKCRRPRKKGIDEMTDDSARTEENVTCDDELFAEELLVEEVSIDGMCGVY